MENDEFTELFPNLASPLSYESGELVGDVVSGYSVHEQTNSGVADRIRARVRTDVESVVIAIHAADRYRELKRELLGGNQCQWQVQQYSSVDHNYNSEIAPLLRGIPSNPSNIHDLFKVFSRDAALEAKLRLLTRIALGQAKPNNGDPELKLEKELVYLQADFNRFVANTKDYFEAIEDETDFAKYKAEYERFYVKLEIERSS